MTDKYDPGHPENLKTAKRLLSKIVAELKAEHGDFKTDKLNLERPSGLFKSLLPHLTERSPRALHIYPAELGGWHSDVELRGMPPGVSNVIGSPVQEPLETREQALLHGRETIRMLLELAANKDEVLKRFEVDSTGTIFSYHGYSFNLPLAALKMIASLGQVPPSDYVIGRLRDMDKLYLNEQGEFDTARFDRASNSEKHQFMTVLCLSALTSRLRWPENIAVPPASKKH